MQTAPLRWRMMAEADLPAVIAIADAVHPDFPEDEIVFANRLALHPTGCGVLLDGTDVIKGYAVSHPWTFKAPPALNSLLTMVASPSTYYIHDLALLPDIRSSGAATVAVDMMAARGRILQLANLTLVAVNNSVHFWQRHGFRIVRDAELDAKLESYGEHARFMVRDIAGAAAVQKENA